jgi:dienelactone hydrolase
MIQKMSLLLTFSLTVMVGASDAEESSRIEIDSDGWHLIGDLVIPDSTGDVPAALLLNQAAGNRIAYEDLARLLAARGIASLRLDLRAHGESTNLGQFVPGEADEQDREVMIWSAEADVKAAHEYLKSHEKIDTGRIAIVGASYSGEEMAEAGRLHDYAQAYVALSPGSFSDESIKSMDESGVPWLFIVSRQDRFLTNIVANVQSASENTEIVYLPGSVHGTDILELRMDVAERIVAWLVAKL